MAWTVSLNLALAFGAVLVSLACSAFWQVVAGSHDEARWCFARLDARAKQYAERPFVPASPLPSVLAKLNYDTYRLIAFEPAAAIWKGTSSSFFLELFHPGYLFHEKVRLNLVENGKIHPLPFERRLFQYRGELADIQVPADIGFAGFRLLGRFRSYRHPLEIASFLGASYFRAIGAGQVYGTSARALAVDIGLAKAEEFPAFREFWIERPPAGADSIRLWALLDSPCVAGAYQFHIRPGQETVFDVEASLHFRRRPEKIGLGPMTSMWMWGDGRSSPKNEPRPHAHDSDGLLMHAGDGTRRWRPLRMPDKPSVSRFEFDRIRGFGLLQRRRDPDSYRDDEAKYHLRPSVWIEPKQPWRDGAVELLEMPAPHEGVDNIAAWWTPTSALAPDTPLQLHYRLKFMAGEP